MRKVLLVAISALALTGCQHMPGKASAGGKGAAATDQNINASIAQAAKEAASNGQTRESLMFNQKLYQSDPDNKDYILSYARDLRRAGHIDDALLVVRTPAKNKHAEEPILTECAKVLVAKGDYSQALEFAQKALQKDDKSPDAHQALALAMSGLDEPADAQLQFQKALELWPDGRDKTPVINNLAMSLAAQGKITEARDVMSLATGEALSSAVYQNNRAMLDSLKDKNIRAEKIAPQTPKDKDVQGEVVVAKKHAAKMQPIVE